MITVRISLLLGALATARGGYVGGRTTTGDGHDPHTRPPPVAPPAPPVEPYVFDAAEFSQNCSARGITTESKCARLARQTAACTHSREWGSANGCSGFRFACGAGPHKSERFKGGTHSCECRCNQRVARPPLGDSCESLLLCASDDGSEDDEPDRTPIGFIVMVSVMAACTLLAIPIGCVARGRRRRAAPEEPPPPSVELPEAAPADVEPYVIVYSPGGERAAGKPVYGRF